MCSEPAVPSNEGVGTSWRVRARGDRQEQRAMTTTRPSILASLTFVAAVLLIAPPLARAQSFSIDTGPGGSTTIGSPALFASGSTACSPQPACSVHFQFLAGQFTLTTATSIDTIQVLVAGGNGSMAVKIRPSTATGVPSLATSLYSKTYTVPTASS